MNKDIIAKSADLSRLRSEGLEVYIVGSHLVVGNIPYVNKSREICRAAFVCPLELSGSEVCAPPDHVMGFTGSQPCFQDGSEIRAIAHCECTEDISSTVTVVRKFSNKPPGGFKTYYDKVKHYLTILWAPVFSIDDRVTPCSFRVPPNDNGDSPFMYPDTNTGRAHIDTLVNPFKTQRIGIVGAGGTGSYILDLASKTPVRLIRLIDGDFFRQHNAYRTPGAASLEDLEKQLSKVDYLKSKYSNMHSGIEAYNEFLNESNLPLVDGLDFVFVCIDDGSSKRIIIDYLLARGIPFADVGVGIQEVDGKLTGQIRVTTATGNCRDHVEKRISFGGNDDDLYRSNIQIAELNMLNAALAVIRWKKIVGFYADMKTEHESGYVIEFNQLVNDDLATRAA